jgi:hypothetical protein
MIFDSEGLLIRASFWPQRTAPGHKLAAKIRFRIEGRFFISTVKGESHLISELPPARGGKGGKLIPFLGIVQFLGELAWLRKDWYHITSGLLTDCLESAHRPELLNHVCLSAGCKSAFAYVCFLAL